MVTRWGLSERLGPLAYGEEQGEVFLGRSVTQTKSVSEETAHLIDEEIRSVIDRNYERAERLIRENIDKMHVMAEALMKYETIDRFQIDQIMEGRIPSKPKDWTDTPSAPTSESGTSDTSDLGANPKPAELH
jgi:cell division protease FtsH